MRLLIDFLTLLFERTCPNHQKRYEGYEKEQQRGDTDNFKKRIVAVSRNHKGPDKYTAEHGCNRYSERQPCRSVHCADRPVEKDDDPGYKLYRLRNDA